MKLVGYADYPDPPATPDYGECDGCGCVRDLGDLAKVKVDGEVKRYCRDCEPEEGEVSEKQSECVTDDPLGDLIADVQLCGEYLSSAYEWGSGVESARADADVARAALREYVTGQLAEEHEVAESLRHVIDAKEQVIEAKQGRIDELESDLRERDE